MSSLAMFLCLELLIAEMVPPNPASAQSSKAQGQYRSRENSCVSQVEKDSKNGELGLN